MEAGEAIARESIRDLISRYNHAGDRGDLVGLCACFHEDGVLDLPDEPPCEGRAAIRERLQNVVDESAETPRPARMRHHVSSVGITLGGEGEAEARSYFAVYTEVGLDHWGVYADRLERRDGVWGFAVRKVRVDGATAESRMAQKYRVA
ncbi:MAG: nuclear transport factor 2 family protein [Myxococcota bacterium]